jgi:putative ABC transport system ATP-binding protein
LLPVLTAEENVEYPLILLRWSARERRQRVREELAKVSMTNFARHRPNQLSGGQRQRVAIARAMAKRPKVVLADEPTANLDKQTAVSIVDLMHELNQEEGVTFLFSSHDPMILSRASHVMYLSDGLEVSAPEGNHAT